MPRRYSDAVDLVYRKAVSKLRALLSASEEAAMRSTSNDDGEDFDDGRGQQASYLGRRLPFAGSVDHLGCVFVYRANGNENCSGFPRVA